MPEIIVTDDSALTGLGLGLLKPSIALRSARIEFQSLINVHLVHGTGVSSLAGGIKILGNDSYIEAHSFIDFNSILNHLLQFV